jgi:CTP-dependent riboflavin kinase
VSLDPKVALGILRRLGSKQLEALQTVPKLTKPCGPSQHELAAALDISQPRAGRIAVALEQAGLVTRAGPGKRGGTQITDDGIDVLSMLQMRGGQR